MKKLLTLLIVLCVTLIHAQDTIVRRDSSRIVAKVKTITPRAVTYQRTGDAEGPIYEIPRADVSRIVYANGTSEKFGKSAGVIPVFSRKNNISVTVTDAVSGMITLNYERIFWNELGVRLSASRGLLASQEPNNIYYNNNSYYSRFKTISLNLDVHYYAAHNRIVSYYIGAAIEYGQTERNDYWGGWYPYPHQQRTIEYYMAGITNGVSFRTNAPVSLDIYTTLGAKRDYDRENLDPAVRLGINVGYRF